MPYTTEEIDRSQRMLEQLFGEEWLMKGAKHNPVAKAVRTPAFRPKTTRNRKAYTRKVKHVDREGR